MEIFFRMAGPLRRESTCDQWIPLTKGQCYGALMFTFTFTEQAIEKTVKFPLNWDALTQSVLVTGAELKLLSLIFP